MDPDLVRLAVVDVSVAVPAGSGVEAGLVVLQEADDPHRRLRIYVGQPEARAIRVAWRKDVPARPSTWDLFVSSVALLGGRVEAAIISNVEDGRHFFAQLTIDKDDAPLILTARPSDAIALALRSYGAGIYARAHVLDQAGTGGTGAAGAAGTGAGTVEADDAAVIVEPADGGPDAGGEVPPAG